MSPAALMTAHRIDGVENNERSQVVSTSNYSKVQ